jgi:hypothetical protein
MSEDGQQKGLPINDTIIDLNDEETNNQNLYLVYVLK